MSDSFSSCIIAPRPGSLLPDKNDTSWKTASFYIDSSGRSSIALPLELTCPSKEAREAIVALNCLPQLSGDAPEDEKTSKAEPNKSETKDPEDAEETTEPKDPPTAGNDEAAAGMADSDDYDDGEPDPSSSSWSLGVEAKVTLTFGTGEAISAAVEQVSILSANIVEDSPSIHLDAEIIVRVSRAQGERLELEDAARVKTNLEVTAVLSQTGSAEKASNEQDALMANLRALNLGGFSSGGAGSSSSRLQRIRLPPFALHVSLTRALSVSVKSVATQTMGKTLVSLTMKHSNTHSEPVTITNIALHPGHSRLAGATDASNTQCHQPTPTVIDMSKLVRWGYSPQSDPNLPLTLQTHEAFSTVIAVDATEDVRSRSFISPLSISAVVGKSTEGSLRYRCSIVAACDVQWTTTRAAVEPADALRVDFSLPQGSECKVGAPMTVSLRVVNLSPNDRNLLLVVTPSNDSPDSSRMSVSRKSVTTRSGGVVSEVDGQAFTVLGLSCGRDAATQKDQQVAPIDDALVLGEMKGNASSTAELRFIPLREGALKFPLFRLHDKTSNKWYNCVHNLRVVATN